jgi:hypothetical protein
MWKFSATNGPHIVLTDAEMDEGTFSVACLEESRSASRDAVVGTAIGKYPKDLLRQIRAGSRNATGVMDLVIVDKLNYSIGKMQCTVLFAKDIDLPKTPEKMLSRKSFDTEPFVSSVVNAYSLKSIVAKNLRNYKNGSFSLFLQSGTRNYTRWARATKFVSKSRNDMVTWKFDAKDVSNVPLLVAEEECHGTGFLKIVCVDAATETDDTSSWGLTPSVVGTGILKYSPSLFVSKTASAAAVNVPPGSPMSGKNRRLSVKEGVESVQQNGEESVDGMNSPLSVKSGSAESTKNTEGGTTSLIPISIILQDQNGKPCGEVVVNLVQIDFGDEDNPSLLSSQATVSQSNASGKASSSAKFGKYASAKSPSLSSRKVKAGSATEEKKEVVVDPDDLALQALLGRFQAEDAAVKKSMTSSALLASSSDTAVGGGDTVSLTVTSDIKTDGPPIIAMLVNYIGALSETESVSLMRQAYEMKR